MKWSWLLLLILGVGTLSHASEVREPTGFDDADQLQWAREVSRQFHVLTVTNRTPHGRRYGMPGQLLYVKTATNRWLFVNDGTGPGPSQDWGEIDVQ